MSNSHDDSFDIVKSFFDEKELDQRGVVWKNIFDKYSNCQDQDGLGISMQDLLDGEEEEGDEYFDEIPEANEENSKIEGSNNQQLALYTGTGGFFKLPANEQREVISLKFSPVLIQAAMRAFNQAYNIQYNKYSQKNLPFWSRSQESLKLVECFSEKALKTPHFEISSRLVQRSKEFQRAQMSFNGNQQNPSLSFDKFSLNGQPLAFDNSMVMQFPEALQNMMEGTGKFTMKVCKRTYDISVHNGSSALKWNQAVQPYEVDVPPPKQSRLMQKLKQDPDPIICIDLSSSEDDTYIETVLKPEKIKRMEVKNTEKAARSNTINRSTSNAFKESPQKPKLITAKDSVELKVETNYPSIASTSSTRSKRNLQNLASIAKKDPHEMLFKKPTKAYSKPKARMKTVRARVLSESSSSEDETLSHITSRTRALKSTTTKLAQTKPNNNSRTALSPNNVVENHNQKKSTMVKSIPPEPVISTVVKSIPPEPVKSTMVPIPSVIPPEPVKGKSTSEVKKVSEKSKPAKIEEKQSLPQAIDDSSSDDDLFLTQKQKQELLEKKARQPVKVETMKNIKKDVKKQFFISKKCPGFINYFDSEESDSK